MRVPRTRARSCGELLEFEQVRRRLHLGRPQVVTEETIPVAAIVGTVNRARDFDGCFRPRSRQLAQRISEIARNQAALDQPVEVVRVDRAYFVRDGHKRVSLARASHREFIDARVAVASSAFALTPELTGDEIELTALELRFREETGLAAAVPSARFPMTDARGYPELREALAAFGFDFMLRLDRLMTREEVAAVWYETVYRPTIEAARRGGLSDVLGCLTDSDLFLALHHQSQALWGTECPIDHGSVDDLVRGVLAVSRPDASLISRLVQRARRRRPPRVLAQRTTGPAHSSG